MPAKHENHLSLLAAWCYIQTSILAAEPRCMHALLHDIDRQHAPSCKLLRNFHEGRNSHCSAPAVQWAPSAELNPAVPGGLKGGCLEQQLALHQRGPQGPYRPDGWVPLVPASTHGVVGRAAVRSVTIMVLVWKAQGRLGY